MTDDAEIETGSSDDYQESGNRTSANRWKLWDQFVAVAKKNVLLIGKHWKGSTASQILAPVIVVLILRMMQSIGNSALSKSDPNPQARSILSLESCHYAKKSACDTLLYAPEGVPWVEEVMSIVRKQNMLSEDEVRPVPGLVSLQEVGTTKWCVDNYTTSLPCKTQSMVDILGEYSGDLKVPDPLCTSSVITQGHFVSPCARMRDNDTITQYMLENPGTTQNVVVFPAAYLEVSVDLAAQIPFGYDLYYNSSIGQFPFRGNDHVLEAKKALDQAILSFTKTHHGINGSTEASLPATDVYFNISWSTFPRPEPRLKGFSAVGVGGGYWFYLPPMIIFFTTLIEIVREKENGSRLMMSVMGLPNFITWIVWFLQGSLFSQLSSIILILSGLACNFDIFWNSNLLVLFLLFSLFGTAMASASQLLATLMSTVKGAQTTGYAIILVGFVFQTILGSGYGSLIYLLQSTSLPDWVVPIRYMLQLYPPYIMSMMYYIISKKSSSIVNVQEAAIEKGEGFKLEDLFLEPEINDAKLFGTIEVNVPKPIYCLLWLAFDTLVFALLAIYFDHVVATGNGIIHHPLFFLKRGYWCPRRKRGRHSKLEDIKEFSDVIETLSEAENKDVIDEAVRVNEKVSHFAEDDSVILVNLLSKTYNKCSIWQCCGKCWKCCSKGSRNAVDKVSVQLEKDSIFCLLGHNGAGKSTTINILTGIISPSSGFVSICGHDLSESLHEIQSMIGVSPQFDCLWDELSAIQHLRLYAAVKGIPPNKIDSEVEYCLSYVDLMSVAYDSTQTFSGGMKRRLSLAIALIGDPKAIFLDEPTTGMDPVHKQEAWSMIQKMKKDRIVVLTTHSMEEADCLGDRIGIMGSGKLQCIGTSLHLKNTFGSGYRLQLYAPVLRYARQLAAEIPKNIPESKLLRFDAGSMTFMVPYNRVDNLPVVMNLLEHQYSDKIIEWSISHTTLEEVFLQVTNGCGFGMDFSADSEGDISVEDICDDNALEESNTESLSEENLIKRRLESSGRKNSEEDLGVPEHTFEIEMPKNGKNERKRQCSSGAATSIYGLVAKNAVLQRRQTFQSICQIGTPIIIMLMLSFLQVLVKLEGENFNADGTSKILLGSIPYSLDTGFGLPFGVEVGQSNTSEGKFCLQHFTYSDETEQESNVGNLHSNGRGAGVLGQISQHSCKLINANRDEVRAPYFVRAASESDMISTLYTDLMELNTFNMTSLGDEPHPSYLLPDGAVTFKHMNTTKPSLGYFFAVNDNFLLAYHRPNGITRARISPNISESFANTGFSVLGNQGRLYVMEMVHRAFMRSVVKSHDYFQKFTQDMPTYIKPLMGLGSILYNMPQYEESKLQHIVQLFGSFLYPIALVLQLPLYMYVSVMEKEKNLRQCQLNNGMSLTLYHVSSFIFNLCMYSCIVIFMVIVGNIVDLSFFSETGKGLLVIFFIGWGLSMVAFAMFLASLVNSSRVATVIGYSVVLFGSGLGIMLSQGVYGDNPTKTEVPSMPAFLCLMPQFAMIRSVYLMNWSCSMKYSCISGFNSNESKEIGMCIGFMYLDFLLYSILGFYLDKVLPKPNEPSSHWLFFLPEKWIHRPRRRKVTPIQSMQDILSQPSADYSDSYNSKQGVKALVDEDVMEEERIACSSSPASHEVVIQNLSKEFGNKIAVQNMGLVIDKNECFGLLGENGAGKTTLIKMLSCSLAPTSGTAYLAGYDVRHESEKIQKLLGICPQFDILWDDLTIREHLLLFLRLKNARICKEELGSIMNEVGLLPFQHKLVKELSGGMKRRLSVAIALVGDSRVVLLDEMTTGLDPFSRRQLWNILKKCQRKRGMMLTTHSMDEAELLCSRIGIMVNGKLRCIGTSSYLKEKFGKGYMLLMNFDEESRPNILQFLSEKFHLKSDSAGPCHQASVNKTEIVKDFPGQLIIRIPILKKNAASSSANASDSSIRMSSIFSVMVNEAHHCGITDWAVSQVGLNEVFQSVLARARAESNLDSSDGRDDSRIFPSGAASSSLSSSPR